ncbi:hypothetical protein L7F22_020632 [Adiantum nelumboides]|nr:hypothetical protein [Adiantum nelumboides]
MQQEQRPPRPPYHPSNRPILCYRCGEYGHYQSKCALPEGSPPCHHCSDSKDHYSKDCPKQRASSFLGSTQNQQEFTFPKINLITVNTIPQPSPATHVVDPQQVGESAGVLTRAQRAALGLSLPTRLSPPSLIPQHVSSNESFTGAKSRPNSILSDIDGAFLEAVADLQQVNVPVEATLEKAKPTAEAILKNTFQQVSLYDMLRLDANLRSDTLSVIQSLYPGVIVDGGSGTNLMLEFTMLALGLQPTHPAPFTVTLADQRIVYPVGIVEKMPLKVQEFTFNLDFVVVSLPQVEGGFPLLIGRPWLRHTKALHDWGNDAMSINTPGSPMQSIRLEGGIDPVVHHSSLSVQSSPDLEQPTPLDGTDDDLLHWLQATTAMPCYVVSIQALHEDTPSSPATQAEQESKNQPSLEQESSGAEEGEEEEFAHSSHGAIDMTSSDASDESYKIPSHMADPDSSSQSDSRPSGRPQVNPKINQKQAQQMLHHSINKPAKSKSQTPFTLNFYLQLPRPSMTDIFSHEQLQKLGLTALATAELPTDVPGDMIHELLSRFPKVRGHNLTPERIGHALGITTFPSVKPATRTYSKISKDATIQACQDLLHLDHPDYARNMELWKVHSVEVDILNVSPYPIRFTSLSIDMIMSVPESYVMDVCIAATH